MRKSIRWFGMCGAIALLAPVSASAGDWPQWGFDGSRNMVSAEKKLPATFEPGKMKPDGEDIDPATTKGVRWTAKLGSQSYGNPVVSGGRVFVGTNNESPRDPRHKGDRAILAAFDEMSGEFLWQLVVPKLGSGKVNDWEFLGLTASPTVEGDRVYAVTNRGEVICLDVRGMANGNDGPFTDEASYVAGPGAPKIEPSPKDADILWRFDMREELGVFPHNATSSSVLIVGDRLYVTTSNGVDWGHLNIPSPNAPSLVVLDKKTGQLAGEESSGISTRILHSNWSSPGFGKVGDKSMIFFGAGDGWLYAFAPDPVEDKEGLRVLTELWKLDANPPHYRKTSDGKPIKYATAKGPSEIIATPVFWKNRVYVAIGQDPEHGSGVGRLLCVDPTGSGDVTESKKVWSYEGIGRSISTVAIADGVLYTADFDGRIYAFDADKGTLLWRHDAKSHIWGSPLVADGKVYIGTEDGMLHVFAAKRQKKLIASVDLHAPVYSTPVVANGVMYVATQTHLYAIGAPVKSQGQGQGQGKKTK